MPRALNQLPDDITTLKRLLIERDTEALAARLMIEKLKLQIARLRRLQFGRKSERHDAHVAQLELIVEELKTSLAAATSVPTAEPSADTVFLLGKPACGSGRLLGARAAQVLRRACGDPVAAGGRSAGQR